MWDSWSQVSRCPPNRVNSRVGGSGTFIEGVAPFVNREAQLKLEAADRLDDEEFRVIEQVIEGVLLKHEVKRLTASA